MDRNAILEDLEKLRAVRIVTAIPDAQQRRIFLREHKTGRFGNDLSIVVHADLRNLLQIDIRGFFSSVDFCAIHIRQKGAAHLAVVIGAHLDFFHLLHRTLPLQAGERGCNEEG